MVRNAVLLIFTGGTICMSADPVTGALKPVEVRHLREYVPDIFNNDLKIDFLPFEPLVDSSDMQPIVWARLAKTIFDKYDDYDGFVVLHGTDTMAYTASALSFMLENLAKPVIFTGSQLPMGFRRSDAKENLLTAIEMATARDNDQRPIVQEVCIFFEDKLYRANRTTKQNAEHFDAFNSYNYPILAKAGVHIQYNTPFLHHNAVNKRLKLNIKVDQNVAILKLFPGISEQTVRAILNIPNLHAVILETYGSGNASRVQWLHDALKEAVDKGIIIVNKTQCLTGSVEMGKYETSLPLIEAGVISGYDITTEALVTKLMYLLGENPNQTDVVKRLIQKSLCGELTSEGTNQMTNQF